MGFEAMPRLTTFRNTHRLACLPLLLVLMALGGCQIAGWIAHGLTPPPPPEVIRPEYQGLIGKSAAVVVAADERTLYQYPGAPERVVDYVTSKLAVEVPDIRLIDPREINKFTRENPDWIAIPYGDLIKELKVDRLIVVDLAQYSTHEQGNRDIWQGNLVARVGVIEAEAKNPHQFAYVSTQHVQYPPDNPVGLLRSNDATIEAGMLSAFATKLGAIFKQETDED